MAEALFGMRHTPAARGPKISPEIAFGRVLRALRREQGVSQDELGARSGYHRTYIGQLERGEKSPSLRTLFNLAATLGVAPSRIVRESERMTSGN
ncbi:MAG: helix-turn-helix domain-containing protein [Candidatus Sulfotelmatobacter sp.]